MTVQPQRDAHAYPATVEPVVETASGRSRSWLLRTPQIGHVAGGILALAITIADIVTPIDLELAPLYVLAPIAAGVGGAGERGVWVWTVICIAGAMLRFTGLGDPTLDRGSIHALGVSVSTLLTVGFMVGRRARANAQQLSERRYRRMFDTLAVAIWEHDMRPVKRATERLRAAGVSDVRAYVAEHPEFVKEVRRSVRITDVNETALRMMGVRSKAEFFQNLSDFLPEEDQSFAKCIIAVDEGHPTFASETRVRAKSGELIPIMVALSFPACSGLDRITGSIMDIREKLRLEAALDRTRQELDEALRAASLTELTASIAHEVGQPLSALTGYAHACRRYINREPPDLVASRELIEDIMTAASRASEVVRHVRRMLDKSEPELMEIHLDPIVAEAVHLTSREAADTGITLISDLNAQGASIRGDRVLLQQVVINLLRNAIQATVSAGRAKPCIAISTMVLDDGIALEVKDDGRGFSEEAHEKAFTAFFTTKSHGMGLGLSISRSAIEMHRGEIWISGNGADGATIRVELPRA
ncbi:hypothetical protein CLG96_18215 [Sphingomonas oleivorans]|uniref:histidine kinase n=1 Tax=Sphingomonas oleivorans TaxID=1735121 RepID=A0A2T5FTS3_9SPHN|nr:PAS domain-containing sensor histidine kinase [Sphingomonas oleivorans]PTQ07471.1 hypothetical protein CLG96_18215 [Sphingomonas oleivorans]